jgi:hypothetical protein
MKDKLKIGEREFLYRVHAYSKNNDSDWNNFSKDVWAKNKTIAKQKFNKIYDTEGYRVFVDDYSEKRWKKTKQS